MSEQQSQAFSTHQSSFKLWLKRTLRLNRARDHLVCFGLGLEEYRFGERAEISYRTQIACILGLQSLLAYMAYTVYI